MRVNSWMVVLSLFVAATGCGNPTPGSGVVVIPGAGIRDYYTVRAMDDGRITGRDILPEPRPREAITGDDYFQIKLEHIFIGDALGRDVGNTVIIAELDGVNPEGIRCVELDVSDLEFDLNQRERATVARPGCAYKHVVSINPVFRDAHVTFDSAFITPPFRMGRESIGLRFIIAQLNDYELARELLNWSETELGLLGELGLGEMNEWQSRVVNIGYTLANYVLDYASEPTYIFELETDFVPVESVGGVTTPQNLFMGGDFVIVGFPRENENAPAGALAAADQLVFESGRLYWRDSNIEFREGPYIVFKVVRESRFPAELPVGLSSVSRAIERGESPDEIAEEMRGVVLDLQDARLLNETEGRYLLDLFEWYADARAVEAELDDAAMNGTRPDLVDWPLQMREVPLTIGADLSLIQLLSRTTVLLDRLDERIYENYERNPGIWQSECIQLRSITQDLVDGYSELRPILETAFEDLQLRRLALEREDRRSPVEDEQLQVLEDAEVWAERMLQEMPMELSEPQCPGLRR